MAGMWSHPDDFLLLPDEEESDGDMNVGGPGRSSGFGVDGDTHMFGPGRSSGFGHVDGDKNVVGLGRLSGLEYTGEETNLLGLHRSSQFGSFNEQNFNSHAVTPFHGDGMQGGLGSSGPIRLTGSTRRMGHRDDLSMVLSPNGICPVCGYVVSGFRCPQCTVCNRIVHSDCCTQFEMYRHTNAQVCQRLLSQPQQLSQHTSVSSDFCVRERAFQSSSRQINVQAFEAHR